jgi:hypothetical protein
MPSQLARFALGLMLTVVCATTLAARAAAGDLRITQDNATISVLDGDRLVMHYRYVQSPFKPYVDQLFSPDGVQVLRNSPADHIHHHGLMYAILVDDVIFWEEDSQERGKETNKGVGEVKVTNQDGVQRAGFVQDIDWMGPHSPKPLIVERRAIDVLGTPDLGATLVDWRCNLQTPPGKESATLTGHPYYGLGMRFVQSMDHVCRFFYADGKPGVQFRAPGEWLTASKWCAITGKADGKPVTVALFDSPTNICHPGKKYSLRDPFAYLSTTMNGWTEPIILKSGKPLDLRFGVALWDGEVDQTTVEKVYQRWLKVGGSEAGK